MTEIVCTLTGDAQRERLGEYARLFAVAFVGRQRTATGVRWSLRADPGIAEWARDLAARENACCAFLTNTVTVPGDRVCGTSRASTTRSRWPSSTGSPTSRWRPRPRCPPSRSAGRDGR